MDQSKVNTVSPDDASSSRGGDWKAPEHEYSGNMSGKTSASKSHIRSKSMPSSSSNNPGMNACNERWSRGEIAMYLGAETGPDKVGKGPCGVVARMQTKTMSVKSGWATLTHIYVESKSVFDLCKSERVWGFWHPRSVLNVILYLFSWSSRKIHESSK